MNRFPQPYHKGKLPDMRELGWRTNAGKVPYADCKHFLVINGKCSWCGVEVKKEHKK